MHNNTKAKVALSIMMVLLALLAAEALINSAPTASISAYPAPDQPLQLDISVPYPGPSSPNEEPNQPTQIYSTSNSQLPQVRIRSSELPEPIDLGFIPPFSENKSLTPSPPVPGWSQLFFDDTPLKNLEWPCDTTFDYSNDGFERYWASAYNYDVNSDAAWPASGGANAVDPHFNNYPPNMHTKFFCGRHDLSGVDALKISFDAFIDIADPDDYLQIVTVHSPC